MHFVAALDTVPRMRGVLGLFEGVVTGAADGYARVAGKPAVALLHLGPGLANGYANLHNARRAATPVVDLVGDHATYHQRYDTPLNTDIRSIAGTLRGWVRCSQSSAGAGADAAAATAAAQDPPGRVATLILPADVSWNEGGRVAEPVPLSSPSPVGDATVAEIASVLRGGEPALLLIGGAACHEAGLRAVGRITAATGVRVLLETWPARLEAGAGLPAFERLAYANEKAVRQLAGISHLVLAGAKAPVSFFAYPGIRSEQAPENAETHVLADTANDVVAALEALAEIVAPRGGPALTETAGRELPSGRLTGRNWAEVIGALLPEGAIVSDESMTSGFFNLQGVLAAAPRHDLLTLTGGAIGQGLPVAVGAAIGAPDRPVVGLQADGAAMYTIQALWTQARESLDVTTVLLNNRAYAVLRWELENVGARTSGSRAGRLFDLSEPDLDFVRISEGLGVPAARATTAEELAREFARAVAEPGPHLIEAVLS
ncbi:acetolactate synthase large subunit [Actinoallomurus bryophytorum]